MKKLFGFLVLVLLVTGCSFVNVEKQSYEDIISSILYGHQDLANVSLKGYSYYLPKKVLLKSSNENNSILYYNHKKMYLYVDVVSYYNKIQNDYEKSNDNYVSIEIDNGDKKGYLDITKIKDEYFVEFMYNYSKIEAFVKYEDLKDTVTKMAYILDSVKFNDNVLNTLIGENTLDYGEEVFNIFKSKRDEENTFLKYEEMYQFGTSDNKKDEDIIDVDDVGVE